jgi:hypothetical protein
MQPNFRYDSRYNSLKKRELQETIELILDKDYGETIPFEQLSKILHYNLDDEQEKRKFRSAMARVKNFLIDYGYVLKTITNVGYYILKPQHISSYCYRTYIDKTKVLLEKSERILTHVDQAELSDVRKKEHSEMTDLNRELYGEIGLIVESSDYGKNRAYYNSLKDDEENGNNKDTEIM